MFLFIRKHSSNSAIGRKPIKNFLSRLHRLIVETARNPFDGIGKPEPLKADLKGYWSRRISDEHRLVYKITNEQIIIIACKYHY
jgi:toxin YoeB